MPLASRLVPFTLSLAAATTVLTGDRAAFAQRAGTAPSGGAATTPGAAGKPVQPLQNALTGDAKRAYEAGKLAYAAGDTLGALAQFERAYEVSKDPRLLWNMAACEKTLRHYARAYTLVSRYLKEGAPLLASDAVASATETQKALRAFYSILTFRSIPAGAAVTVDGVAVGTAPLAEPLALDIGPHRIGVAQAGFAPFEATVNAPGTTDLSIDVILRREETTARLTIVADDDATVMIDGRVVGQGKFDSAVPAGAHVVRITADGKKPYEATVDLAAKSSKSLQVALESAGNKPLWPWIVGGAVVVGGAAVGGYFLFKPKDEPGQAPVGKLGTVYLPAGMRL